MKTFEEALRTMSINYNKDIDAEFLKFQSLFIEVMRNEEFKQFRETALSICRENGRNAEFAYNMGFVDGLKVGIEMEKQE